MCFDQSARSYCTEYDRNLVRSWNEGRCTQTRSDAAEEEQAEQAGSNPDWPDGPAASWPFIIGSAGLFVNGLLTDVALRSVERGSWIDRNRSLTVSSMRNSPHSTSGTGAVENDAGRGLGSGGGGCADFGDALGVRQPFGPRSRAVQTGRSWPRPAGF